jgi:cell division transport system ATP-binding protein
MDHRSTLANLLLPLQIKGDFRRGVARELAREALASVGLTAYEKTKAQKLSTGEKQRLSIARALIIKPDILLADEPTAHLDATWANRISALLLTAHRRGTTLLVATHETKLVDELNANLTIQLESGRIVALDYNPVDKRVERAQEASPYPQELKPVEVLS